MSANYWESTQRQHWLFTKDQLASMRQKLDDDNAEWVKSYPLPEQRHLAIFFNQHIKELTRTTELLRLGKRLSVRQQALATAQVYLKRFYSRVQIRSSNPYLVLTTALYLACKMEESPQHIRLVVTEARQLWQDFIGLDTSKIGECEFYLISEMSSQLIVHQPYRTLTALRPELSMTEEDYQMAKSVINDHYMTDLPLLHPPHIIALVGILLALVLRPVAPQPGGQNSTTSSSAAAGLAAAQAALHAAHMGSSGGSVASGSLTGSGDGKDRPQPETRVHRVQMFVSWLSDSNVDVTAMVDATQEIISYYACYETEYNDKNTKDQIHRFVKARHLDK